MKNLIKYHKPSQNLQNFFRIILLNSRIVTVIGSGAFYNCANIESITFEGTKVQWKAITFIGGNKWNYNVPVTVIFCTDGDVVV